MEQAITSDLDQLCELCESDGGVLIYRGERYRVVLVEDAAYPGFCRVIWHAHVKEMTDLVPAERSLLMRTVCIVEEVIRAVMAPEKINLASLGNMTPHLHWHVIPRYLDDAHFPAPVWAEVRRETADAVLQERHARLPQLIATLAAQLAACDANAHA